MKDELVGLGTFCAKQGVLDPWNVVVQSVFLMFGLSDNGRVISFMSLDAMLKPSHV